jgi:S1-C subfamily serine protease
VSHQAAGIGFAIPSNTARAIAHQLITAGSGTDSPRAGLRASDDVRSLRHGVTPERFSPTMPARTSAIDTILSTDTEADEGARRKTNSRPQPGEMDALLQ